MAASTTKPRLVYKNWRNNTESGWLCFRFAIGPKNIAVSGYHTESRHSYIDVTSHDHTDFGKTNFTQRYEPYDNCKGRHVSFVGETLVTCVGNTFEKVNCQLERTTFTMSGRDEIKCMAARSEKIFVGLWNTSEIDVYDSVLGKFSKTVASNGIHPFDWPYDMAVTTDKIIVCTAFGRVIAFTENEGKFIFEYFNVATPSSNALSVTVSEKFHMVCVLWDSGQICIYSLECSNCLLVFQVKDIINIRMDHSGDLYLLHKDGVQCIHMIEVFTYDNARFTLPYLLSEEELRLLAEFFGVSSKNISELKLERLLCPHQRSDHEHLKPIGDGSNVFEFLVRDNYMSKLRRPLNHYWINRRNIRSVTAKKQFQPPFRDSLRLDEGFGIQDKWRVSDFSLYGDKLAVSCRVSKCKTAFLIFQMENACKNLLFLPWQEPKIIDEGAEGSVRYISLINETKIATCCNKSIAVYDFEKREDIEHVFLDEITSCIAVNGENIFVGFKCKMQVDVFDFDLRKTERIVLQGLQGMWLHHLTVTCDNIIVCASSENSSRALSFGRKDGCLLTEYVNILGPKYHPQSVTLSTETIDEVWISWIKSDEDETEADDDDDADSITNDDDRCDISEEGVISFHSLSSGHFVALVNNLEHFGKNISSFRDKNEENEEKIMTVNHRGEVNMYSKEDVYSEECWKTTMSFLVPFSEWEAIRKHFNLTVNECDDSSQPKGNFNPPEKRVHGLLTILQEKEFIHLENVSAMEKFYNELFKFHLNYLRSPFRAVSCLQDNPDDFKTPGYNQPFSKTVLETGHSPSVRKDNPDTLALSAHSESTTHSIPIHHPSPMEPVPGLPPVISDLEMPSSQLKANSAISNQENKEATPSIPGLEQSEFLVSLPSLRTEQIEPLHNQEESAIRKRRLTVDCSSQNPTAPPQFTKRAKVYEDVTTSTSQTIPTAQRHTDDSEFCTVHPNCDELGKVYSLPMELTPHAQAFASEDGFNNNYVGAPRPHPLPSHYAEKGETESTKQNTRHMPYTSVDRPLQHGSSTLEVVLPWLLQDSLQKLSPNLTQQLTQQLIPLIQNNLRDTAPTSQKTQCESITGNTSQVPDSWNSLHVSFHRKLQPYKDNADDREMVALLVTEHLLTHEERLQKNTSGKKMEKVSEEKLQMIREIVFFLCPPATSQNLDRVMQKEWLKICRAIDESNRHYREKIKRQENRKLCNKMQ